MEIEETKSYVNKWGRNGGEMGGEMDWTLAMIELNELLETFKEDYGVTKKDVLQEVDNVFGKD